VFKGRLAGVGVTDYMVGGLIGQIGRAKAVGDEGLRLDLSENSIRDGGAEAIADAVLQNSQITGVDLSKNAFGHRGGAAFGQLLHADKLARLSLGGNSIGNRGVTELCDGLKIAQHLTYLDLSRCEIGTMGGRSLAEAVGFCEGLVSLDASWNNLAGAGGGGSKSLTNDGEPFSELAATVGEHPRLAQVNLAWNSLGDKQAVQFSQAVRKNQANSKLAFVDLTSNSLTGASLGPLAEMMGASESLHTLVLNKNGVAGFAGCSPFLQLLQDGKIGAAVLTPSQHPPTFAEAIESAEQPPHCRTVHLSGCGADNVSDIAEGDNRELLKVGLAGWGDEVPRAWTRELPPALLAERNVALYAARRVQRQAAQEAAARAEQQAELDRTVAEAWREEEEAQQAELLAVQEQREAEEAEGAAAKEWQDVHAARAALAEAEAQLQRAVKEGDGAAIADAQQWVAMAKAMLEAEEDEAEEATAVAEREREEAHTAAAVAADERAGAERAYAQLEAQADELEAFAAASIVGQSGRRPPGGAAQPSGGSLGGAKPRTKASVPARHVARPVSSEPHLGDPRARQLAARKLAQLYGGGGGGESGAAKTFQRSVRKTVGSNAMLSSGLSMRSLGLPLRRSQNGVGGVIGAISSDPLDPRVTHLTEGLSFADPTLASLDFYRPTEHVSAMLHKETLDGVARKRSHGQDLARRHTRPVDRVTTTP
jgi:hypothetical protein